MWTYSILKIIGVSDKFRVSQLEIFHQEYQEYNILDGALNTMSWLSVTHKESKNLGQKLSLILAVLTGHKDNQKPLSMLMLSN